MTDKVESRYEFMVRRNEKLSERINELDGLLVEACEMIYNYMWYYSPAMSEDYRPEGVGEFLSKPEIKQLLNKGGSDE